MFEAWLLSTGRAQLAPVEKIRGREKISRSIISLYSYRVFSHRITFFFYKVTIFEHSNDLRCVTRNKIICTRKLVLKAIVINGN